MKQLIKTLCDYPAHERGPIIFKDHLDFGYTLKDLASDFVLDCDLGNVAIFPGSFEDPELNWDNDWVESLQSNFKSADDLPCTVIVKGDLKVKNLVPVDRFNLIVLGEVQCENFYVGGSTWVSVAGNVKVKNLLSQEYNDTLAVLCSSVSASFLVFDSIPNLVVENFQGDVFSCRRGALEKFIEDGVQEPNTDFMALAAAGENPFKILLEEAKTRYPDHVVRGVMPQADSKSVKVSKDCGQIEDFSETLKQVCFDRVSEDYQDKLEFTKTIQKVFVVSENLEVDGDLDDRTFDFLDDEVAVYFKANLKVHGNIHTRRHLIGLEEIKANNVISQKGSLFAPRIEVENTVVLDDGEGLFFASQYTTPKNVIVFCEDKSEDILIFQENTLFISVKDLEAPDLDQSFLKKILNKDLYSKDEFINKEKLFEALKHNQEVFIFKNLPRVAHLASRVSGEQDCLAPAKKLWHLGACNYIDVFGDKASLLLKIVRNHRDSLWAGGPLLNPYSAKIIEMILSCTNFDGEKTDVDAHYFINEIYLDKVSPLHMSFLMVDLELSDCLIEQGADLALTYRNQNNSFDNTVYDLMFLWERNTQDMFDLMREQNSANHLQLFKQDTDAQYEFLKKHNYPGIDEVYQKLSHSIDTFTLAG